MAVAESEAEAEVLGHGDHNDVRVAVRDLPDRLRAALGQPQLLRYAVSHNTQSVDDKMEKKKKDPIFHHYLLLIKLSRALPGSTGSCHF